MNGNVKNFFGIFGGILGGILAVILAFIFIVITCAAFASYVAYLGMAAVYLYNLDFKLSNSSDYLLMIFVSWSFCKMFIGLGKKLFSKE